MLSERKALRREGYPVEEEDLVHLLQTRFAYVHCYGKGDQQPLSAAAAWGHCGRIAVCPRERKGLTSTWPQIDGNSVSMGSLTVPLLAITPGTPYWQTAATEEIWSFHAFST
jgi:hypothetical protein